jgi:hypothetical protein
MVAIIPGSSAAMKKALRWDFKSSRLWASRHTITQVAGCAPVLIPGRAAICEDVD